MHVVTVATGAPPELSRFTESCALNGIYPAVLECGSEWRGFGWRFKAVIEFLKRVDRCDDIRTDALILHADAYDTACQEGVAAIVEKFRSFNHPWVFSWQDAPEGEQLCAGLWIGRLDYILNTITDEWLEHHCLDHFNDETQLQDVLRSNPGAFALDRNSVLFHTLTRPLPGDAKPSFLHFPNA